MPMLRIFPALLMLLLAVGCNNKTTSVENTTADDTPNNSGNAATTTADAGDSAPPGKVLIKKNDRLLFVGDDLTQQFFYPRATMNGLMAVMPRARLRYFTGGMSGATAGSAAEWVDDLFDLTDPTVVFFCFGLNEAQKSSSDEQLVGQYKQDMSKLIEKAKAHKGVRMIVLLSPPAVPAGATEGEQPRGVNARLTRLAFATVDLARRHEVMMIDLFEHMYGTYGVARTEGVALAYSDKLPAEHGHVVIASLILRGLGVSAAQLEAVDWSPVKPLKMGTIRPTLALPLPKPDPTRAELSYYLYELHRNYDTAFFKAWRLAGKRPSAPSRDEAMQEVEQAWGQVYPYYIEHYGN